MKKVLFFLTCFFSSLSYALATNGPKPWQMDFRPPATPTMEMLVDFHNFVNPIIIAIRFEPGIEISVIIPLNAVKIFVDTPADIRVIRRIKRDINKRGRDLTSIIKQYFSTVRNMHFKFVEPTKKFADIILNEGGKNPVAIKTIENTINTMLMEIDG